MRREWEMVYKAKVERVCGKKRENGRKEGAEKREGREGEGNGHSSQTRHSGDGHGLPYR